MNSGTLESDVLLARDGDQAAFGRLVEASANTVCSIALSIVRNVPASEDIAQETYVAAWGGLKNLRNPSSFLPWLRQVTRNQAHLWTREHRREVSDEDAVAAARDERAAVDDRLVSEEERNVLREVLDQLPASAREVLILYYREGNSTRQVSRLLGISEEAVRQRLARSRATVRDEMLQRFGRSAMRTAPAAAFVAAAAVVAPAPAAAGVLSASAASTGGAALAKATAVGALLGWAGVLVGMRLLGAPVDAREAEALRSFRNRMLLIVTVGASVVALSSGSILLMLVAIQSLYAVIATCYAMQLPRILNGRFTAAAATPEEAKYNRRRWMRATIGGALTAAITGTMLMAMMVIALR